MSECGVCCGEGKYPVIDNNGKERFLIKCPVCFGLGKEVEEEPEDLPPSPTAADHAYLAWKARKDVAA